MIVLDAYGLIAYVGGEQAGGAVRSLMRERAVGVASVNLAEAGYVLERRYGIEIRRTRAAIELLRPTPLTVVPVDERHAWRASELRSSHYQRRTRPISLADCVLLAVGAERGGVATADRHLLEVAEAEDIPAIPLV